MQPHFHPARHGAQHSLDEQDVVIVRGTPVYQRDTGSRDARICIRRNGYAERAVWVTPADPGNRPGLRRAFHLWSHQLDEAAIARIGSALDALGRVMVAEPSADRDANGMVRSIRFWHGGRRVEAVASVPEDGTLSAAHAAAFRTAWDLIDAAVPAGD